jgi:arylsulfatase A-like enzyme/Flp pilus assembly protein TadD
MAIRRFTLQVILALLIGMLSVSGWAAPADKNLLLITIDTLRPDRLSCYSPKYVQTPVIDALAARGVLFERAFAHDPMTLPSHTNILLGMTSLIHGVNENGRSVVPKGFTTLAEWLKGKGYATAAFVSSFALDSRFGLNRGFDIYDDHYPSKPEPGQDYAERRADKTIAAALEWLSARKGQWFCWIHLWDPHYPYTPPEPYATKFAKDPYSGEVAFIDAALEKLLTAQEPKGWRDKTFIILTGDHGESLGEHGELTHSYFAYNSTIWVPLIVSGPGMKETRIRENVSHIDIFPTVCELLGVAKPRGLQGESLAPFLAGKSRKAVPIYFEALEASLNNGWAPLRGFIEEGKKYIDSPIPELYSLEADFDEKINLAPLTDLAPYKKRLADMLTAAAAAGPAPQNTGTASRETRERLRSLGYLVAPMAPRKNAYGPQDDLKTLLPLRQKLDQASRLEKAGKIEEAARLLEEVIQARKDFHVAYVNLARLLQAQGKANDALRVLQRGYNANPDNYSFVSAFGIELVKEGKYKSGIDVLQKAAGMFEKDAEVWNSLGLASWKAGSPEKGLEYAQKALDLAPKDAIYNDNMGSLNVVLSQKTKDPELLKKAVGHFKTAMVADPGLASVYNGLGGALSLQGDTDGAIANWEKAIKLQPDYEFTVYNLAYAYFEKGDKTRALVFYRRYLDLKGVNLMPQERQEIEAMIEKCKK